MQSITIEKYAGCKESAQRLALKGRAAIQKDIRAVRVDLFN